MAKHVIYMGAYSLDTWVKKILSGEIELPPYQRPFVWNWNTENDKRGFQFLDSLEQELYIPPVTLGEYEGKTYLIDGQQRLTSLLLFKNKLWPKHRNDKVDEDEDMAPELIGEFTFKTIQDKISENKDTTVSDIMKKELDFENIEIPIDDSRFSELFIPYCHIKWIGDTDKSEQQKFYSQVFDRINTGGKALTSQEVREAQYWVHGTEFAKKVQNKEFEKGIKINNVSIDYISYLSIVFAKIDNILKGYSRSNEDKFSQYVSEYVQFLTDSTSNKKILRIWNSTDKDKITKDNYDKFIEEFKKLNKKEFDNIAIADYYLFGLIHYVYNGKKIKDRIDINSIDTKLQDKVNELMPQKESGITDDQTKYKKSPNSLGRIRYRVPDSIALWEEFMEDRNAPKK